MSPLARFSIAAGVLMIAVLSFLLADQFTQPPMCELGNGRQRAPESPDCVIPISPTIMDRRLEQAFGKDCEEVRRPLRLWLPDKKVVLAASDFSIANDGRVRMAPLSIAFFREGAKGEHPEIVCVRCDEALVTLDKPVANHGDLARRQFVKAELRGVGGVTCTYNRGSADKKRSLDTLITDASVIFDAEESRLTTDSVVCMTDWITQTPTIIRGKGMEMQFAKPLEGSVSAVERFTLRSDVEVRSAVDAECRFMSFWQHRTTERSLIIKTGGSLVCDLVRQTAWFIALEPETDPNKEWDKVHVRRTGKEGDRLRFDQLVCDQLEVRFRHGKTIDILAAKATSLLGNDITLALDGEKLSVQCHSYHFASGEAGAGANSIIKGCPLRANLYGNKIWCDELTTLHNAHATVTLIGQGQMDLLDWRNQNTSEHTKHIRWRDKLIIGNRPAGQRRFDSFTAFGAAEFVDDDNQQHIRGEQIDVRLGREPAKKK